MVDTSAICSRWTPPDAKRRPLLALIEDGEVTAGSVADYLRDRRRTYATGTVRHYERALAMYVEHLLHRHPHLRSRVPLELLTQESLAQWWEDLRTSRETSTARTYIGAVPSWRLTLTRAIVALDR